ncbi:MAG TPA: hypothetical protein VHY31_05195 [Streptosporangiaceae bacterium]|nr:hypothetical protein [Streptosporangiaceae bacterium]
MRVLWLGLALLARRPVRRRRPVDDRAPGHALDEQLLRKDLRKHVASGVTMIRLPGLAGDPPAWFGRDPDVRAGASCAASTPRAGPRRPPRRSTRSSTAWASTRACWPPWLPRAPCSLPTLGVISQGLERARNAPDSPREAWYVGGASGHGRLVAQAAEAGVTILAGTDSRPHGRIADEIRVLARAGLRPHDALAAGSWAARAYLGLPGLAEGAPADLGQLDHPRAVILRGQLRHRRRAARTATTLPRS